jgi:phage tail sheath protein FI
MTTEPRIPVPGVETAVPAFIGYTESAVIGGKPAYLIAVKVNSLADYEAVFGGPCGAPPAAFNLFDSLRLFYANGGATCYICSVGAYRDGAAGIDVTKLADGLAAVGQQKGVTMLVVPDAVLLPSSGKRKALPVSADFDQITRVMLQQCAALGDRVALLDVYGTDAVDPTKPKNASYDDDVQAVIENFQQSVGDTALSYGIAYFPFLVTSIAGPLSLLPPSGAMAGVYAQNDDEYGVWNTPANVTLSSVVRASLPINDTQEGPINTPVNGKAVNVIRDFVGRGTVVWGSRTLDGNSSDWRYVSVRRLLLYIENSIKEALNSFVFAPNDANTWVAVTAMVTTFLMQVWTEGGLMGDKASDAFSVACGLGSTMTAEDIANGYMILLARLQVTHPAEFIELSFTVEMQG